jgi:PTS system glucose-specific IIC component
MMLPVSVLPIAGILLGVGAAELLVAAQSVSLIMAKSGDAIFGNLPLLFAIGVAIGLTDNDGVSALAGTTGYVVFLAAMGVCAKLRGIETVTIMGIQSDPRLASSAASSSASSPRGRSTGSTRSSSRRISASSPANAPCRSSPRSPSSSVGAVLSYVWPPLGTRHQKLFRLRAVHWRPKRGVHDYGLGRRSLIPFGPAPHFGMCRSFSRPAHST